MVVFYYFVIIILKLLAFSFVCGCIDQSFKIEDNIHFVKKKFIVQQNNLLFPEVKTILQCYNLSFVTYMIKPVLRDGNLM